MLQGLDKQAHSIYSPISSQLDQVEEQLRGLAKTSITELEPLLEHVLTGGGKRVRAALTLLASELYPHDSERPLTMAAAVELLHLATLIHDDTIDNTDFRRGKATVSSLWGKHMAVLLGDYVFAASATLVCDTNNIRVIRRFSETIMELASGEVMEYFNCYKPEQARHRYHERIYRKTASLFCTAAETGAILGSVPEAQVQQLRDYGYNVGMAFQIVDDLLDVKGDSVALGKPVGNDLRHGVLTLPAIMLLERYPHDNPIEAFFRDRTQLDKLEQALNMISDSGVVTDCYSVIRDYCFAAGRSLEALPESASRRSLDRLADYIWERTR